MEIDPKLPERLPDLPEALRLFLAGIREQEIENLRMLALMRPDERARLKYLVETFTDEDLEIINANLENLRAMKRFGKFGLWLFGFIVAGASAAALIKTFFSGASPK